MQRPWHQSVIKTELFVGVFIIKGCLQIETLEVILEQCYPDSYKLMNVIQCVTDH